MSMHRYFGSAITAALLTVGSSTGAMADPVADPIAMEISGLFREACVTRFPDAAALDTLAHAGGMVPMQADDVRDYLHTASGHGWYYRTAMGSYALTVENSPLHACSVR